MEGREGGPIQSQWIKRQGATEPKRKRERVRVSKKKKKMNKSKKKKALYTADQCALTE